MRQGAVRRLPSAFANRCCQPTSEAPVCQRTVYLQRGSSVSVRFFALFPLPGLKNPSHGMAPPSPTRSGSSAPPLSSLSSQSASIPSTQDVIPVNTVSSACCSSTPNIVVLDLHTTIVIPNYSLFYSTPIASFLPDYRALADGSLVAPPLISDIESANVHLALMSALAMFFIITTLTSIRYIRRGKFKKKILFYILFASQLLGLVSIVALIIPFFNSFVSCTAIGFVVILGTLFSYSLLMTGILGMKAYRCLNNSRLVILVLAILRTAMVILIGLDLTTFQASRRLSGSCMPGMNTSIIPIVIILESAESAFICGCFLTAVWQAARASEDQGRMSIRTMSLDDREDKAVSVVNKEGISENGQIRRGWWDYVPEHSLSDTQLRHISPRTRTTSDHSGMTQYTGSKLQNTRSYPQGEVPVLVPHRKPSLPEGRPIRQPSRTSTVTFSSSNSRDTPGGGVRLTVPRRNQTYPTIPPSPSAVSRLSKYMPRLQLFRQVLKNELYYTSLVTIIYLIIAILVLVGMSHKFLLNSVGWVALDWFLISCFTMHSFDRVVRRHEKEAILQHPSAWDPLYRAELEASRAFQRGQHAGRAYSPISVVSRRVPRGAPKDPFEDPRLHINTTTVTAADDRSSTGAGHSILGARASYAASEFSTITGASRDTSIANPGVDAGPIYQHSDWSQPVVLPSPMSGDYPYPQSASSVDAETPLSEGCVIVQPMTTPTDISVSNNSERTISFLSSSSANWEPPDSRSLS